MPFSITITGVISMLLSLILTPEETNVVMSFIEQGLLVVGIVLTYWGRIRLGDLTWYGTRK
jgi:hypothetical protein